MTPTCATCRYYNERQGECRRFPPQAFREEWVEDAVSGLHRGMVSHWPHVSAHPSDQAWCGEHVTQDGEVDS